ncbi:MAG: AMP-binding protein, partial [Planctomycetota bacterium]
MSIATESTSQLQCNIGNRLTQIAERMPGATAVVMTDGKADGKYRYRQVTFAELEEDSNHIAAGLQAMGVKPGTRLALMVKPSIDFVSLTFALFKTGAVTILIDPGMGKDNLLLCLEEVQPQGFVAIPIAHVARILHRSRFPAAEFNVTVGRRWLWGGPTLKQLRATDPSKYRPIETSADDEAAIIFTTGSTGPPKGVLFQHGTFAAQVDQIRERYDIQPGGIDLAGFPLFGLFNAAMGTTTVIPDMDASRPASVDPNAIVSAVRDWDINQSFASPAVWNSVGRYCEENDIRLTSLRRVLSAGAPVPNHVLARMKRVIADDGDIFTPYGATESLPVASISASEVLGETGHATASGSGTCVGRRFSAVDWKVIKIVDGPIERLDQVEPLP